MSVTQKMIRDHGWRYYDYLKIYHGLSESDWLDGYRVAASADGDVITAMANEYAQTLHDDAESRGIHVNELVAEATQKIAAAGLPSATGKAPGTSSVSGTAPSSSIGDDGRLWALAGVVGLLLPTLIRGSRGVVRANRRSEDEPLLRIENAKGRPFFVRVVGPGDRYGRDDVLVYPDPKSEYEKRQAADGDVLIEFYDAHYSGVSGFGPRGQFVSRYYLSTLAKGVEHRIAPLSLQGDEPVWTVEARNVREAVAYAKNIAGI